MRGAVFLATIRLNGVLPKQRNKVMVNALLYA